MRRWQPLPEAQEYLKPDMLLALLSSRGLQINDMDRAAHYLRVIGYHRLRAYVRSFYQSPADEKQFVPGTSFNDVINLYTLDRELRLLLMGPIEKIEIALRALVVEALGEHLLSNNVSRTNIHVLDENNFNLTTKKNRDLYNDIGFSCLNELYRLGGNSIPNRKPKFNENTEYCVELIHQFSTYHLIHSLAFGTLSKIFSLLGASSAQSVSNHFGIHRASLKSVLASLTKLRNACAHHEPIWFRQITPMRFPDNYKHLLYPDNQSKLSSELQTQKIYIACAIIHIMLSRISETTTWYSRLRPIISRFGDRAYRNMGFPKDWDEFPIWRYPKPGELTVISITGD